MATAGKPVAGASVIFHPVAGAKGDEAHKPAGTTDKDGAFVLTTYTNQDGAPEGEYAVTVELRAPAKSPGDDPADKFKGKFSDFKTAPFKATVAKGDNDLPPIKLP